MHLYTLDFWGFSLDAFMVCLTFCQFLDSGPEEIIKNVCLNLKSVELTSSVYSFEEDVIGILDRC